MYEVAMSSTGEEEQIIQDGFPEIGSDFTNTNELDEVAQPILQTNRHSRFTPKAKAGLVTCLVALLSFGFYNISTPNDAASDYPELTEYDLSARWGDEPITSNEDNNFVVPVNREFASEPTIDRIITASIVKSVKMDKREIIQSVDVDATAGQTYTIAPGDTLSGIAKRMGVKVQALIKINAISDPRQIKPGMKLLLSNG